MDITYIPPQETWRGLNTLVGPANTILETMMKEHGPVVQVEWRKHDTLRGILLELQLKSPFGNVSTTFEVDDFSDPRYLHVKLYRLWSEYWTLRNNAVHGQARILSGQIQGEFEESARK